MTDPRGAAGVEPDQVVVIVADEQDQVGIDTSRWGELARCCLADLGAPGELTLTFVDTDEIHALNAEHMGHDRPTDVLSFPLDVDDDVPVGPRLLGDVVICPAVAAAAAPDHAGTLDDEIALLVVHGVLHILGHDHVDPAEAAVMRAAERVLLERFHWHGPAPAGFSHEHAEERTAEHAEEHADGRSA